MRNLSERRGRRSEIKIEREGEREKEKERERAKEKEVQSELWRRKIRSEATRKRRQKKISVSCFPVFLLLACCVCSRKMVRTALHDAAEKGDVETLKLLLCENHEFDVNERDDKEV